MAFEWEVDIEEVEIVATPPMLQKQPYKQDSGRECPSISSHLSNLDSEKVY